MAKQLLYKLKFQRAQAAAPVVAKSMYQVLPEVPHEVLVVPIPTASSRRRQRGYDQAELIAKHFVQAAGGTFLPLLHRHGQSRQVGNDRKQRLAQLSEAFWVDATDVSMARILLVDDVTTTGATLEAAAGVLRKAGARHVEAIVFAQA